MKTIAKRVFTVFTVLLCIQTVHAQNSKFEKLDNGVIIYFSNYEYNSTRALKLEVVTDKIIHVIKSPELPLQEDTSLMILKNKLKTKFSIVNTSDDVTLSTGFIKATVSLKSGLINFTDLRGNKLLKEDDNVKCFKPISIDAGRSWQVQQSFSTNADEAFYGLGQHQQGLMNYKVNIV
ncbi:MAG: alpha-xylosidase, partial [Bacteroidia bacterium]